ncbi:MAG TPA: UDP-3-O-acyl-N-acetylglucosamine deacetylase [Thermogutta sp.]|nr:UDP-3-O-acyl-N-acetylglucosamine deacetylase [Thermogutta sp.]
MLSLRPQQTIARAVAVEGFGYWSGTDVRVEFRPAPPNSGIVFVREDLRHRPRIPARLEYRMETPRRSSLEFSGARVEMVEHVMAALGGLQIDNCEISVTAAEMPGCDGSALPFVEALLQAGIIKQSAPRAVRVLTRVVRVEDRNSWFEARPGIANECFMRYLLDYGPDGPIGRQSFGLALTPESFCRELAPCRTFMLKEEAEWLLTQGLGRRTTPRDVLVFDADGPIDNQLRFPDECVRHKLLDIVGDLALCGCDFVGRFSAYRSGHRLNAEMGRNLLNQFPLVERIRSCA